LVAGDEKSGWFINWANEKGVMEAWGFPIRGLWIIRQAGSWQDATTPDSSSHLPSMPADGVEMCFEQFMDKSRFNQVSKKVTAICPHSCFHLHICVAQSPGSAELILTRRRRRRQQRQAEEEEAEKGAQQQGMHKATASLTACAGQEAVRLSSLLAGCRGPRQQQPGLATVPWRR
jgi:hypothetical protein